jgi:hypothetical protein
MGNPTLNNKPVPRTPKYKFYRALSIDTISDVYSDTMINPSLFTPTSNLSLPHGKPRIILPPRRVLKRNSIDHHKGLDGGNTHSPSRFSNGVRFETLATERFKISTRISPNPPDTFYENSHSRLPKSVSIDNPKSPRHDKDMPTFGYQDIYPPERGRLNEIREDSWQELSFGDSSIISDSQRNICQAQDIG